MEISKCIFCGVGTSDEHIVGKWLIRDCSLEAERPLIGFAAMQGESVERVAEAVSPSKFVLKSVCKSCNNGWMSRLENKAKTALSPFLQPDWPDSDRTPLLALRQYSKSLALWLLKSAITFGEKMTVRVPEAFRCDVMNSKIPDGVVVEIARSEYRAFYVTMGRQWLVESNGSAEMRGHPDSFRLTFQVRQMILRLSCFPSTKLVQRSQRSPVRIYPQFVIPNPIQVHFDSGIIGVKNAYVYPDVGELEEETMYREVNPQSDHRRLLAPW